MPRRTTPAARRKSVDLGDASITARQLSDHAVGLAMNLSLAQDESYGVWADAARHDLSLIRKDLAEIEAALEHAPKRGVPA